ncbi:hypothetical protein ACPOLB_24980 [Rubrivivax sp. RP6-9]|uniref:hypothetical protein n=1 Tax=Rubrivivax sp. RP6-9 TaxID=3415750 RepID=UPI003CC5911B
MRKTTSGAWHAAGQTVLPARCTCAHAGLVPKAATRVRYSTDLRFPRLYGGPLSKGTRCRHFRRPTRPSPTGVPMDRSTTAPAEDLARMRPPRGGLADNTRTLSSAVSWGAIAAGAAAAAALSLILLMLGVGFGLSSVSPWAGDGVSATTFGVSTIVWLTLTQLLASAMGGYLAGRLRARWIDASADEVYFRDTAHGFLAWAVASLATAALLTSAIGSIIGSGVQAGAAMGAGVAGTAGAAVGGAAVASRAAPVADGGAMDYFVDVLFRREAAAAPGTGAADVPAGIETSERASAMDTAAVGRIFTNVSRADPLPPEDVSHVGQIVARRTGLSQQQAELRVADVYARAQARARGAQAAAREAADKARQASAYSASWLFVSLLIGAFVASLAATLGGRRRDA